MTVRDARVLMADGDPAATAEVDGRAGRSPGAAAEAAHQRSFPPVVTADGANLLRQAKDT
ncbi:hypothetical protein GCM10010415_04350 [Streptomyces atrovirens]